MGVKQREKRSRLYSDPPVLIMAGLGHSAHIPFFPGCRPRACCPGAGSSGVLADLAPGSLAEHFSSVAIMILLGTLMAELTVKTKYEGVVSCTGSASIATAF